MVPVILTSDLILIERFVVYRPPRTFHSRISFVKKITFTVQRIKIVFDDMKQRTPIRVLASPLSIDGRQLDSSSSGIILVSRSFWFQACLQLGILPPPPHRGQGRWCKALLTKSWKAWKSSTVKSNKLTDSRTDQRTKERIYQRMVQTGYRK